MVIVFVVKVVCCIVYGLGGGIGLLYDIVVGGGYGIGELGVV